MSIYATWLSIQDERQEAARMAAQGISYGVIDEDGPVEDLNELPPDMLDAPVVYEGSHVLPTVGSPRGGSIDVAGVPGFITRDGSGEGPEGSVHPWLRLMVVAEPSSDGRLEGGLAAVVLTDGQVRRLRDTLSEWLQTERP